MVAEVKAMACEPPQDRDVPQSRWSAADLAARAQAEGLVEKVARSAVWRWLEEDAIRPWRYWSWIFPAPRSRDPSLRLAEHMGLAAGTARLPPRNRGDHLAALHPAQREAGLAAISHAQRHHRIRRQLASRPGASQGT